MAHVQEALEIEIQYLKEALDSSQKKADRYAKLVTALSDELKKLRNNVCHSCKMRLVPGSVLTPTGLNPSTAASSTPSTPAPFWRALLQGRLPSRAPINNSSSGDTYNSKNLSSIPKLSPTTPETIFDPLIDTPATASGSEQAPISSPEPESKHPKPSVVYNLEVKRTLDLHLSQVFAHDSPFCMKISPDGQKIAVGALSLGKTVISEVNTGSKVRVFVDRYIKDPLTIWSVSFGPDGRLLATGANDSRIRIWDITQNRMRAMFRHPRGIFYSVTFSPDGHSLVSGSEDGFVGIWNVRDGSCKKLSVTSHVVSVVFSPDGRYIGAGDLSYSLWIWDSRTHKVIANWGGHENFVWCVKFTPDGKGLMSGSSDGAVKYWDVSSLGSHEAVSGKGLLTRGNSFPLIRTFHGHTGRIRSIAFFPGNTQWVITGSDDFTARVWDMRTGAWQLMVTHKDAVKAVDVSATSKFLAIASLDGPVTLCSYTLPT